MVVESAVVGYTDPIRGDCPVAFVILRGSSTEELSPSEKDKLAREINDKVRSDIGPIARLEHVMFT